MPINFNQLRIFYHTAKHLSFTKGAEELFITQPAVTAQMKSFEEFCEFKLFQKRSRKTYLTPEGEALFKYAKVIFEYEQEVERLIEELRELKKGLLRLGAAKTYSRCFLSEILGTFKQSYEGIDICLYEGSSHDVVQRLLDFTIDLAVIAKDDDNPEVEYIPFSREELVPIISPEHPLAWATVSLAQLAEEPLIMKEEGSGTKRIVSEAFHRRGLKPKVLLETSSHEMIKELVSRGSGYTFLSRAGVIRDIERSKLARVTLSEGDLTLDVYIAHTKGHYHTFASRAFMDLLLELVSEDEPLPTIDELKERLAAH